MSNDESFKEFFNSDDNPDKALPPKLQSFSIGSTAISGSLVGAMLSTGLPFPEASREEFAEKVASLSQNEEFISELSDDIGFPLNDETEDEFVARAKSAMAKLLRRKLG